MNKALPACIASLLLAAAGAAGAQSSAPAATPAPERPPAARDGTINLKLDETDKPRPRIMFGPPPGASQGTSEAASSLPSLGAEPGKARVFDRAPGVRLPSGSGGGGGPFPKDTNPGL